MNILEIGTSISGSRTRRIKYISNSYFLDADLLIIDLDAILMEFNELFTYVDTVKKAITKEAFADFIEHVQKRQVELQSYFKNGGNLLLFNSDNTLKKFLIKNGEQVTSEGSFDFLTLFNLNQKNFQLKRASGHNLISQNFYKDFFECYFCSYEVIYTKYLGNSIASVTKTDEPVALCVPIEKGNILFLPALELHYEDGDDDEYRWEKILDSLEDLNDSLKSQKRETIKIHYPDWIDDYMLGTEKHASGELLELEKMAEELQGKIHRQYEILDRYRGLKSLLFESGKNLEKVIEDIFKEFGYEILPAASNRDDLIIKFNDEIAVIEIKGVNGSASEKNAVQLEKWVSEYRLNYDVVPKGILIVNAFREKPIIERTEDTFPNQMLKYALGRDQCLMSTTDLLNIYLAFSSQQIDFGDIHRLLFNTTGVLNCSINLIEKIDSE